MAWNQQTATQYGLSSKLLQQGEQATGGLLQQRANAAGVNLNPVIQSANTLSTLGAPAQTGVGAMPVGIEPLHDYEKRSLQALGNYQAPQGYAQGQNLLGQLSGQVSQYTSPITQQQFQQGVQDYSDPYQQQVTDYAVSDVERRADELRNRIYTRNPSARSYSTSSEAVQLGDLARNEMNSIGQLQAQGGSAAFQGATDYMLANRAQGLQGLQAGASLAGSMSNLAGQQQTAQLQALGAQGTAGGAIRNYNQGISDIALQDYTNQQNFAGTQLGQLGTLTGQIPSTNYALSQTPSTGQQVGAGIATLGTLLQPSDSQGRIY